MSKRKQLFPGPVGKPTWAGMAARGTDSSGIVVGGSMDLSSTIVSQQDGPRMSIKNFGGRKAAPFTKGKKRRAKLILAKRKAAKRR